MTESPLEVESTHGTPAKTNCPLNELLTEEIQKKRSAARKVLEEKAEGYRAKYGDWLTLEDARKISLVEENAGICAKCTGYPCKKRRVYQNYEQYINVPAESQTVYLEVKPCRYMKAEQAARRISRNFERCRIPPKYVGKDFESYEVTDENAVAVKWAKYVVEKKPTQGLLLYGTPGVGKTHLAAIIAQELLKAGKTVIFGDIPSILDAMKATFGNESKQTSLEELMKALEEVDLLILDDIGTENPTEWAAERLYLIVNSRYSAGKPIIATSNFNAAELVNRLKTRDKSGRLIESDVTGQRIVSRLCEMCQPVKIGGVDRRLRR